MIGDRSDRTSLRPNLPEKSFKKLNKFNAGGPRCTRLKNPKNDSIQEAAGTAEDLTTHSQ
jgi:hypothetical protein